MDNLDGKHIKIHNDMLLDDNLTAKEVILYGLLDFVCNEDSFSGNVTNEFLAKGLRVSQRTLNKLLQSLEDKNLIKRHYKNGDLKQRYFEVLPYHAE